MQIQVNKIWLFETQVTNPFFLETIDGVTTSMLNSRTINLLDIVSVYFFFDNIARGGMTHSIGYGGEDDQIIDSYGKSTSSYKIEFNVPTVSQNLLEKLVGKEFAIVGMRRDLSRFCVFGRFTCSSLNVDNEVLQRVSFESNDTNAKMFNVQSMNITTIENVIDSSYLDDLNNSFDYTLDFSL